MIPVQQIFVQTKEKRTFDVYIEKHSDNNFEWNLYCWDPKSPFSGGYSPKAAYNNSDNAYEKILDFIIDYVDQRNDNDSIEFIDNPCNCELIDLISQKALVSKTNQSFPVKVNGKF
jgi:hypothetical protein